MDDGGGWLAGNLCVPVCSAQRNHLVGRHYDRECVGAVRCSLALKLFQDGWVVGTPVDKDMVDAHLYQSVQEEGGGR